MSYKFVEQIVSRHPELNICAENITAGVELICSVVQNKKKIFTCGNGGSSSDADHIVAEFMKGFHLKREVDKSTAENLINSGYIDAAFVEKLQLAIPAISLSGNMSLVTAICNDVSSDYIFAQQIFGLAREGDLLICLSTSGNSVNILNTAKIAKAMGLSIIGFTGEKGGVLKQYCDILINAPSDVTPLIQEYHLAIYHAICAQVENELFN